jgi:malto-oligosyltrehalose trehalohydrolase
MNLGETRAGVAHPSAVPGAVGEGRERARSEQPLKRSFVHAMPFGAEIRANGAVRFRLWAPGAIRVELLLQASSDDAADAHPMSIGPDGFHELTTTRGRAGSRYRYRVDGGIAVPDPASRANPGDVHGASEVVDPRAFAWEDDDWRGRPWREAVIYELHVGAFTPEGTFRAAIERLPYLAALGVTAIELMPIADFPGRRNWGYDGALLFAPDASYGTPDDLKALVQAAHRQGLMIFLDVVYNHFGPEGNYLNAYAPAFFSAKHRTLWGQAINFDGEASRTVRDFYVHNTLYWLEEYRFDGLRYDAVHAIHDESRPNILEEIAAAVHDGLGREREIHLVLENDDNAARYLHPARAAGFRAQWNDDVHHAMHVLATGETDGYYADYVPHPAGHLLRCLAEGFDYQGGKSTFRDGRSRGEPSALLPPTAFVGFLQNHDQIGNRAQGERITMLAPREAVRCLTAILLLAPQPPLLFMGQEFAAGTPFQFFCDFEPALARAVAEGRRAEFARFAQYGDAASREKIPDPGDAATFARSHLAWSELNEAEHAKWLEFHRELLAIRCREIVPLLSRITGRAARSEMLDDTAFAVEWLCTDGARLTLLANVSGRDVVKRKPAPGRLLHATPAGPGSSLIPAWSAHWYLT